MKRLIDNLRIDNEKFAEIIKNEKLVLKRDKLFEIATPITAAVIINIGSCSSISITSDMRVMRDPNKYTPMENIHFIYNGEVCRDLYRYLGDSMRLGAFTVGICTSNTKEYEETRLAYEELKRKLEKKLDGGSIRTIDREDGEHKAYILTYRRK